MAQLRQGKVYMEGDSMTKMGNSSKKAKELKAKFVTETIHEISEADISSREMIDVLRGIGNMAEEIASKIALYALIGGEGAVGCYLKDMVTKVSRRYEELLNEDGEAEKDAEESEDEEEGATIAEVLIGELLRSLADDISGRKSHEDSDSSDKD